jgi:phosphate starvation-inducible protein PhoH and related proteins
VSKKTAAKAKGKSVAKTSGVHTAAIEFDDNSLLASLIGPHGQLIAQLGRRLSVDIHHRGNRLTVEGAKESVAQTASALQELYGKLEDGAELTSGDIDIAAKNAASGEARAGGRVVAFKTPRKNIAPRSAVQSDYCRALQRDDLVLGIGPAGTGKTYLAVAAGIALLAEGKVDRLILSRPAVEAGEKLGFLPGSMEEKVDPYLRPIHDALRDMLMDRQIAAYREEGKIEIAPLAFMRGRTLSNAFVILDEAQNTTPQQMKMFLTRLGEGSQMVVTGDPTQVDLPRGQPSGLDEAREILEDVAGVGIVTFTDEDVVRHPLVQRIVRAYDAHERRGRKR